MIKNKTSITILMALITAITLSFMAYAGTGSTNATLTITSTAPTIIEVFSVSPVTLNTGTTKDVFIRFNASDDNGASDINITTASIVLNKTGETSRTSTVPCDTSVNGSTWIVFNCTVSMQYYDAAGTWNINASVKDNSGNFVENITTTLTVNSLDSINLQISTIDFGSASAGTNDVAGTSLGVNNTGNTDYVQLAIKAYNLTTGTDNILASNFCANDLNDANVGCDALVEATDTAVTGASLAKGFASQEILYTFVDIPIGKGSGSYSAASNWVVTAS